MLAPVEVPVASLHAPQVPAVVLAATVPAKEVPQSLSRRLFPHQVLALGRALAATARVLEVPAPDQVLVVQVLAATARVLVALAPAAHRGVSLKSTWISTPTRPTPSDYARGFLPAPTSTWRVSSLLRWRL